MNKYRKGFLNCIIGLVIGCVGMLISLSIWMLFLLFLPELATKVDGILGSNPSWFAWNIFPGTIPFFYLLSGIALPTFVMFKTIKLIKKLDIDKITYAIKRVSFPFGW